VTYLPIFGGAFSGFDIGSRTLFLNGIYLTAIVHSEINGGTEFYSFRKERRMKKAATLFVAFLALSLLSIPLLAQVKTKVFVADVTGPDNFMNERFKLLFMEELLKTKSVQLVTTKEEAQIILEAMGQVVERDQASITSNSTIGTIGTAGASPNALLSLKAIDSGGKILFVGNKSSSSNVWTGRGATQEAVVALVKDLKKKLKWN